VGRITRAILVSQLKYASPAWRGYLKADERNRIQTVIKKAIRYGYLLRSFNTLDELRAVSDEKLVHIHVQLLRLLPQHKTLVITFVNAHTISHYLQTSMLSSNKTLSIECCSETSVNFVFMFRCYFISIFYPNAYVFYIIKFIFLGAFHSMSHVRLSYVY